MQFRTSILILCFFALTVQLKVRAIEANLSTAHLNSSVVHNVNIKDDWLDLAAQAIELVGKGVNLLKSTIGENSNIFLIHRMY